MATLEEIRKRIQQSQQEQNAVVVSQLSPTEKKRRLKRLKELLARLKRGNDITRRDLEKVLTEEQWNDYEQVERVISNYYQKIVYNPTLFVIETNQNNPAGYYYQTHFPIITKVFSDYIEEYDKSQLSGVPNYAYFSETNNTFIWRDLYDYGFIDTDGRGVDFPFMNGKHYPYENYIFRLIPEGKYTPSNAINVVNSPTIDGCE